MILEKIKALCKERGVSIAELEKRCNLGNATIRGWEQSVPRVDKLKSVADFFGLPLEYFLE